MDKFFMIIILILNITVIVATLMMEPKTRGIGAGYGSAMDTNVFGKNSHHTRDHFLGKIVSICAVIFLVAIIVLDLIQ